MVSSPLPVVVLRSNDTCTLGAVRSLGAAGHSVTVVGFDYEGCPAWSSQDSRFCSTFSEIVNPASDPRVAASQLGQVLLATADRAGSSPALIATSDTALALFDLIEASSLPVRLMGSEGLSLDGKDLNDKVIQGAIVASSGLPIPGSTGKATLRQALSEGVLQFPLILKPRRKGFAQSFYRRNRGAKCLRIETEQDLLSSREFHEHGEELVFQNLIEGDFGDEICVYVSRRQRDQSVMVMSGQKHEVTPNPFGTASILESVYHSNLERMAVQLADNLHWDGVLMVEFKLDKQAGEWKCLEVNFRPWLFIDFPRRLGFNFLGHWLGTEVVAEGSVQAPKVPEGHIHASLLYLQRSLAERGKALNPVTVAEILSPFRGKVTLAEWDPSDRDVSVSALRRLGVEGVESLAYEAQRHAL